MATAYDVVLSAMRSLGGAREISEVADWIAENEIGPVASLATVMADLTSPPNNSTKYPLERQFLERVERGRYRIRANWDELQVADRSIAERSEGRTISQLSDRNQVIAAIEEYEQLGEGEFFRKYKFGPAKWWYLVYNDKQYASKAIAGVAAWNQSGRVGKANNFSGGEIVARKLTELGFQVVNTILQDETAIPEEVDETYPEHLRDKVFVNRHERSAAARLHCIAIHGTACAICGMNLGAVYGSEFTGLIHVHHLNPRGETTGTTRVNPRTELLPVCPNCHAALHHGGQLRTPDELNKAIGRAQKASNDVVGS